MTHALLLSTPLAITDRSTFALIRHRYERQPKVTLRRAIENLAKYHLYPKFIQHKSNLIPGVNNLHNTVGQKKIILLTILSNLNR